MMMEILWEITAVKKTKEITSQQALPWGDGWKCREHKKCSWKQKKTRVWHYEKACTKEQYIGQSKMNKRNSSNVNTVGAYTCQKYVQHMARDAHHVGRWTLWEIMQVPEQTTCPRRQYTQRALHEVHQDNEETLEATNEIDVIRSNVFNVHSIRSVLIAKLKTKISQKQKCVNLN